MTFPSLSRERLGGTKAGAAAFRWATSDRPARSVRLRVVPSLVGVPGPIAVLDYQAAIKERLNMQWMSSPAPQTGVSL